MLFFPKRWVKKIGLIFLLVLLVFGTYKVCFWVGETYFFDKLFYQKSEAHGYTGKLWDVFYHPDQVSKTIHHRLGDLEQVLSDGEAGENFSRSTTDEFIVSIIGDSNVYGTGVRENERFSVVLEKMLHKIKPTKVYNYGFPGDNVYDYYAKFLLAEKKTPSDLYIFGMVFNDLLVYPQDKFDRYPGQIELMAQLAQLCPLPLFEIDDSNSLAPENWSDTLQKIYLPALDDQYSNTCYLQEITKSLKDKPVIFFNLHNHGENDPSQPQEYIMYIYSRIAQEQGISVISAFEGNYEDSIEFVSKKEMHPSKNTHEWYAEVLFKEITTNPKFGFK